MAGAMSYSDYYKNNSKAASNTGSHDDEEQDMTLAQKVTAQPVTGGPKKAARKWAIKRRLARMKKAGS